VKIYYVVFVALYLAFCYGIEARQMTEYKQFKLAVTDSLRVMQKYDDQKLIDSEMARVCRERGIPIEKVSAYIEKLKAMNLRNYVIRQREIDAVSEQK
jgi:hypothetical protein